MKKFTVETNTHTDICSFRGGAQQNIERKSTLKLKKMKEQAGD